MRYSFLGLSSFKSSVVISDTADDARLLAVLESISRQIEQDCQRRFQPYTATEYFGPGNASVLLLDSDLLSVTSLKTDDGNRTYPYTWAVTDYDLAPDNAPQNQEPYWMIEARPYGAYNFPLGHSWGRRSVEIAGVWGYWLDTLAIGTIAAAIATTTTTSVTMTAGHGLEVGNTVLIDSEQLYITAVSTNTLTVERGVNGTTAATHLILASVALYRYPGPIVEALRVQANRIFQRVHAPFGVVGSAEMGTATMIARIDPDVKALISRYRSGLGMIA